MTTERAIDYGEMGRLAARAIGTSTLVLPLPKFAFWTLGAVSEAACQLARRPHYLNLDKMREVTAPGWVCLDEKIRLELGYQPAAPLEQQFAETARWYAEHQWLSRSPMPMGARHQSGIRYTASRHFRLPPSPLPPSHHVFTP